MRFRSVAGMLFAFGPAGGLPMSTTGVSASSSSTAATTSSNSTAAFRDADFMNIMLAEVTNQNPLDPQDTSKMVEGMRQLQELANTKYEKFRSDLSWAQDLVGKPITIQQMAISDSDKEKLVNKGLNPAVGYNAVSGRVESFTVVDEQVYVTVQGKDFPIDNLKQVTPAVGADLAEVGDRLIGKTIVFHRDSTTDIGSGTVKSVAAGTDGGVLLKVGEESIPYEHLLQIGL